MRCGMSLDGGLHCMLPFGHGGPHDCRITPDSEPDPRDQTIANYLTSMERTIAELQSSVKELKDKLKKLY
jgi:hypothetical protein